MFERGLYLKIWKELSAGKNMIFLAGPRQSGKTTLGRIISKSFSNQCYFNWDIPDDRTEFLENPTFFTEVKRRDDTTPLIIFDEIHKYKDWKNYLKGIYDQFFDGYKFLISGSGRLDIYQKGSDSLAGRYFLFHLWPFTIAELGEANIDIHTFKNNPLTVSMERNAELSDIWMRLSMFSGFPEPWISNRQMTYRRWSNIYSRQLIREDIRDLTDIKSVQEVETLYMLLPSKIGSPLSIPSLSRDLKVSYNSVRSWLSIFETYFLTISIYPWTREIVRAVHKERKVYLWDSPRIRDPAARFENMVALELYRAVSSWNDMGYGHFSLHFIRNKEHQEVDFLIADDYEPLLLIEAKLSDSRPSKSLVKFQNALNIPAVQLINEGDRFMLQPNGRKTILIVPACQWLAQLP